MDGDPARASNFNFLGIVRCHLVPGLSACFHSYQKRCLSNEDKRANDILLLQIPPPALSEIPIPGQLLNWYRGFFARIVRWTTLHHIGNFHYPMHSKFERVLQKWHCFPTLRRHRCITGQKVVPLQSQHRRQRTPLGARCNYTPTPASRGEAHKYLGRPSLSDIPSFLRVLSFVL